MEGTMAFRTILAPMLGDEADRWALDAVLPLARRMNAHVKGLHVRQTADIPMAAGMLDPPMLTTGVMEELEKAASDRAVAARGAFEAWIGANRIAAATVPGPAAHATAEWTEIEGYPAEAVARAARLADLTVLGRPARAHDVSVDDLMEGALFSSGRPVMVVPAAPRRAAFESIVIAWNDSPEAAGAVAAAAPLLGAAKKLVVFVGDEIDDPEARGADLAAWLGWRHFPAPAVVVRGGNVGVALLEEASKASADLIVMGAYTHSRLRQLVFGGATSHVLGHSPVPLLMSH